MTTVRATYRTPPAPRERPHPLDASETIQSVRLEIKGPPEPGMELNRTYDVAVRYRDETMLRGRFWFAGTTYQGVEGVEAYTLESRGPVLFDEDRPDDPPDHVLLATNYSLRGF